MSAWRPRPSKRLGTRRRYLGSWCLPSGNSCNVYIPGDVIRAGAAGAAALSLEWDDPPSTTWPREDVEHWQRVTFPEILRAVADVTGERRVVGVIEL